LLKDNMTSEGLYDIIHLKGEDIEIAFTHTNQYGEEYYSFVNGQHTTQGGTHQTALKEHIARTIKEFYNKNQEYADIRNGLVAAIAIDVEEPMFESQTKTKLGSNNMWPAAPQEHKPAGPTVNKYVGDFIKTEVDNYLHKNPLVAEVMLQKIQDSEKERKAIAGVTKLARERAKKANLHNRKLRDCRYHLSDGKGKDQETESCIFITEGDSASGSITKSRDVNTQAVFSLRGKPLNSYGLTKKVVYENEEFNLLQAALNIEDGIETLRYNKVIVATDADERNGDSRLHAKHATADDDAQRHHAAKPLYSRTIRRSRQSHQGKHDGGHCHAGTTETGCHQPAACRPALHETHSGLQPARTA
jgi:topoisomerase-4 subunit B